MQEQVFELYRAFDFFNHIKFNNLLEKPTITIQSKGNNKAYGWCSSIPIWSSKYGDTYEINISAEYLQRPFNNIMGTLLHEMVHLYNSQRNIKDTSRNGTYHNEKFKDSAINAGLDVAQTSEHGWSTTDLNYDTKELLSKSDLNKYIFNKSRIDLAAKTPKTKKSHSIKYVCGNCGNSVRATKEVNIMCIDCQEQMYPVD